MIKRRTKKEQGALAAEAEMMLAGTENLTDKERLFVAYYLQTMDQAQAARLAGYTYSTHGSLRTAACLLMKKPKIRKVIDEHLLNVFMDVAEMKARLTEHARGSMDDFLDIDEATGEKSWNFKKAKEAGVIRLIKKLKMKEKFIGGGKDEEPMRIVETELELYDSQSALEKIGKLHNLFKEPVGPVLPNENDTPLTLMAKAYQAGIAKGEKIAKCSRRK